MRARSGWGKLTLFLLGCNAAPSEAPPRQGAPSLAAACVADGSYAVPLPGKAREDWFIANYIDHDPTEGVFADYKGGGATYDGHNGIDIFIPDLKKMEEGVKVFAAQCGVVIAVEDSIPDGVFDEERACGNFVKVRQSTGRLDHYCHLRQGSVAVAVGAQVVEGDTLGLVGFSGKTTGPHLHLGSYSTDRKPIDLFIEGSNFPYDYPSEAFIFDAGVTTNEDPALPDASHFLKTPEHRERLSTQELPAFWFRFSNLTEADLARVEVRDRKGRAVRSLRSKPKRHASGALYWTSGKALPQGSYQARFFFDGREEQGVTRAFTVGK